jgi:hypothetical protein
MTAVKIEERMKFRE